MAEEKKLFVLIDWDDNTSTDVPITCIKKPRKEDYVVGESVKAICPGFGLCDGVIAAIDEDRQWLKDKLKGPRPVEPKHSPIGRPDKPKTETERQKPECKPVKRKLTEVAGYEDEVKKAKREANQKQKQRAAIREETLARATSLLLSDDLSGDLPIQQNNISTLPAPAPATPERTPLQVSSPRRSPRLCKLPSPVQNPTESRVSEHISSVKFRSLETKMETLVKKMDECIESVNSLRTCRTCVKKLYKSFDQIVSPEASKIMTPFTRDILSDGNVSCSKCHKYFSCPEYLNLHMKNSHASMGNDVERKSEGVSTASYSSTSSGNDTAGGYGTELTYIGEPRFGVQMKASDFSRCQSCAKTPGKLALNLLEYVVPDSMIKEGVTVYGNKQHKLTPLPPNIVEALKSYIFSRFPMNDSEKEQTWEKMITSINDKLKHLRKGNYKKPAI